MKTSGQKLELSEDEQKALKEAGLLEKFQALPYSHQREYRDWIVEAKKPETRQRRIDKLIEMLAKAKN